MPAGDPAMPLSPETRDSPTLRHFSGASATSFPESAGVIGLLDAAYLGEPGQKPLGVLRASPIALLMMSTLRRCVSSSRDSVRIRRIQNQHGLVDGVPSGTLGSASAMYAERRTEPPWAFDRSAEAGCLRSLYFMEYS